MEVDAKRWLEDVDNLSRENAMQIALLQQRMETNHAAVMQNSDVRLSAIMERFDKLDKQEEQEEAKKQSAKRLWIPLALTVVLSLGGLVKLAYVDPLTDRLDAYDRRLKYVEEVSAHLPFMSEPK
jgi:GTP-binding protein EngB required for normal cell division